MLPDSLQLTNELRDKLISEQKKCGRTVCESTLLTYYNKGTDKLYCSSCARKINENNPGLCILYRVKYDA
jgi:hypothetical protein